MGQEIEFNYDKAIDRAMRLFWKNGYSKSGIRQLLKVMRIGEGSFYNTFKSKKNLYLECLKHYGEIVGRKRAAALMSDPSLKISMRAFFRELLDQIADPQTPRLCLMAGSLSTDVLEVKDFHEYILARMSAFECRLVDRLKAAQETGELSNRFEAELISRIIGTYINGLFRMSLISFDRKRADLEIEVFLASLGI